MATDTIISLPGNVRVQDVASVLAKLLGCESRFEPIDPKQPHYGMVTRVDGIEIRSVEVGVAQIKIHAPSVTRSFIYDFESYGTDRSIWLRRSRDNIALAIALVDFFGGVVDFDDSDGCFADYKVRPRPDRENQPESDQSWLRLQQRIHALTPVALRAGDTIACALGL